jgi:hypothetical protein
MAADGMAKDRFCNPHQDLKAFTKHIWIKEQWKQRMWQLRNEIEKDRTNEGK